jgi:Peptidase family M1 domain
MHAVLLPFLVATVACPQVPPRVEPAPDRPRYTVNVKVTRPFRVVTGDLTVTFTPNRPTGRLVFRLWPNGPPSQRRGARLDVGRVTSPGPGPVQAVRPNPTTLIVSLGRRLQAGSQVTVHVPWRLQLPSGHDDRIAHFRGGLRLGTFIPLLAWDPRRGWLADPPAAHLLAENAATPAADFDLRVQAPSGLRAIATGAELGPGHFRAHTVRDIGLAVGPFRVHSLVDRGVTVRVASTSRFRQARTALGFARRALRILAERYGRYPWHFYTLVIPPDLGVTGIEYPMLSFIGRGGDYERLIVEHETAHQWFYSLVGNNQARDPWLDETLATWAQTRLGSAELPPRQRVPTGVERHVGESMTYWDRQGQWYFYGVYGGGVKALRSLHNGAAVDCALRRYVARRAYGIAQPGDLLDELNGVIPDAERRLRAWGIRR